MSASHDQFVESALLLPQAERADLAFQLLQSLTPPGSEVSTDDFADELRRRIAAYHRGEMQSVSLQEARACLEQQQPRETGQ